MTNTRKPIAVEYMTGTFRIVGMDKWELLALIRLLHMTKGDAQPGTIEIVEEILQAAAHLGITPKMEGK